MDVHDCPADERGRGARRAGRPRDHAAPGRSGPPAQKPLAGSQPFARDHLPKPKSDRLARPQPGCALAAGGGSPAKGAIGSSDRPDAGRAACTRTSINPTSAGLVERALDSTSFSSRELSPFRRTTR